MFFQRRGLTCITQVSDFKNGFCTIYLCDEIKERIDIRGKSPIYWPEEENDNQMLSESLEYSIYNEKL